MADDDHEKSEAFSLAGQTVVRESGPRDYEALVLPSLAPVVVKSGPPDVGGDIWRRKCQGLKRKCEELEKLNEILFARTKRIHVMIKRAEAEKRFLIGRLEQYEDIEFPSKVALKIPAPCIDTASIKSEVIKDEIKKEEKSRTVGPPPALLGPFPASKRVYQQEDSGISNSGTTSAISTTSAALSLPAPQVNPKSKQPGTSATGTSARAPKQRRATKAGTVSGGGKPKKESTGGTRKRKSDADPLAPKKPSNSFFWFCQERRPGLQEHFKGEGVAGQHDLTKVLAKLWSETSAEDKKKYYELYAEDKKRYDRAMEEYTKKQKLTALVAETRVEGGSKDNCDKPSS